MPLRGIIFDLDGTLVDSRLDFDAIRSDLGLPDGVYILEALAEIPEGPDKDAMLVKLRAHERAGSEAATLIPGVAEFLSWLDEQSIRHGILTRNSREGAELVTSRLNIASTPRLARDDARAKPDPAGLLQICETWDLPITDVIFVGDFVLDLETGHNAGMRTALFASDDVPDYASHADFVLRSFYDAKEMVEFFSRD